jgi:hypothetical protein
MPLANGVAVRPMTNLPAVLHEPLVVLRPRDAVRLVDDEQVERGKPRRASV